jgi:bifunctional non-homologous end joining protein LigD
MLATSAGFPPDGPDWVLELKWDGCRGQLIVDDDEWQLRSRPGRCVTGSFSELSHLVQMLRGHRVVLDGELVCLGPDGKPDFHALRPRFTGRRGAPCTFVIFDLLHLDGRAVWRLPYAERRSLLAELLPGQGQGWRVPEPLQGDPRTVLDLVAREHLEGIVAKRLDWPYEPGRRARSWMKLKARREETFALTAWSPATTRQPETFFVSRRTIEGVLLPAGGVQLGLRGESREALRRAVAERTQPTKRRIRPVAAGLTVTVDFHGPADRPLRDAVMRSFAVN